MNACVSAQEFDIRRMLTRSSSGDIYYVYVVSCIVFQGYLRLHIFLFRNISLKPCKLIWCHCHGYNSYFRLSVSQRIRCDVTMGTRRCKWRTGICLWWGSQGTMPVSTIRLFIRFSLIGSSFVTNGYDDGTSIVILNRYGLLVCLLTISEILPDHYHNRSVSHWISQGYHGRFPVQSLHLLGDRGVSSVLSLHLKDLGHCPVLGRGQEVGIAVFGVLYPDWTASRLRFPQLNAPCRN